MLKLSNNVVINETHIVTAKFENDSKTLTLVFSVPVTFAQQVESNSNEVQFKGDEAENLWHFLLKDAQKVPSLQSSGTTGGNQYLAGETLPQFKPL